MTPHIEAKKEDIAKTVIMPGDPRRAKYIAEKYLENAKLVNEVRGILAYTGTYKQKPVTVMASGMGMPSMGIYCYELFKFYEVDNIIRIGSCGALKEEVKVGDVILATSSYTDSNFAYGYNREEKNLVLSSEKLNENIIKTADKLDINLLTGTINTSDLFYNELSGEDVFVEDCLAVEMEAFALFFLAGKLKKEATSVLTVTDHLISNEKVSSKERETGLDKAITLILESL